MLVSFSHRTFAPGAEGIKAVVVAVALSSRRRQARIYVGLGALRTWTRDAFDRLRRNRPEADMGSITIPQCGGL